MSATILNLVIVVLASLFIGVMFGRRSGQKSLPQAVEREREKIRAEVRREHTDLAVELHGELSKVRDSIIQSAHAYQNVVKTIDERLAPWSDVMPALAGPKKSVELPLLKVETAEDAALSQSASSQLASSSSAFSSEMSAQPQETGSEEGAEPGIFLQKKAAELIKEDRAAASQRPAVAQDPGAAQDEGAEAEQTGNEQKKVSDISTAAQKRSATDATEDDSASSAEDDSEDELRKRANAGEGTQIH